uniref:Uncharacterized protein n=1 Tax=Romanomermis culicivorax TaxID=13658 RepID=A0A915J6W4_ROMCU
MFSREGRDNREFELSSLSLSIADSFRPYSELKNPRIFFDDDRRHTEKILLYFVMQSWILCATRASIFLFHFRATKMFSKLEQCPTQKYRIIKCVYCRKTNKFRGDDTQKQEV